MSVLIGKESKILVQGITGKEGSFHTQQMIDYGTNIVAGVTPGKGGQNHLGKPVFNTVSEAVNDLGVDVSVIFVPPKFAASAIIESIDARIEVIVCITEGIPIRDMIKVKSKLLSSSSILIGPNCPGVISPGIGKVGIMPGFIHSPGNVGVISRSGTLTYEAVDQLTKVGLGQSTCIGIGGDPIIGTSISDAVKMFMEDKDTSAIVMIGEIGGEMEAEASRWIQKNGTKPVIGFIAGKTAPAGRQMGHAGAIIGGEEETASIKMKIMRECGVHVVDSPADIGKVTLDVLNSQS